MAVSEIVLKRWLTLLPLKRQSSYLSALRGPDTAFCRNVKLVVKLLRSAAQIDADPTSGYMGQRKPVDLKELERELEFCTLHFVAHLLEALTILAVHGPVGEQRSAAEGILRWFEETYHLAFTKEV